MTTENKGKLFILFVPLFTLPLLSKIVCSLCGVTFTQLSHYFFAKCPAAGQGLKWTIKYPAVWNFHRISTERLSQTSSGIWYRAVPKVMFVCNMTKYPSLGIQCTIKSVCAWHLENYAYIGRQRYLSNCNKNLLLNLMSRCDDTLE